MLLRSPNSLAVHRREQRRDEVYRSRRTNAAIRVRCNRRLRSGCGEESLEFGCTRAPRQEMLRARTAGGLAKDTASRRAPSSLLTSAFEPGRFVGKVPLVEA